MRPREELFRGKLQCTTCHQEKARWNREADGLIRNEDGTYSGYCMDHRPDDYYKRLHLTTTCMHFEWELVAKLTIHELDPNRGDRKGDIITVEMRDIANKELAQSESIKICQALMLIADDRCVIHYYGERGEQNNCWVEPNYHWQQPATCTIRDKYWGDKQIKNFRAVCRVMARVHGWELVDETVGVLDRIAQALEESPEE
jgi:hypothetical protein